jgi:hypothetical protein
MMWSGFSMNRETTPSSPHPLTSSRIAEKATAKMPQHDFPLRRKPNLDAAVVTAALAGDETARLQISPALGRMPRTAVMSLLILFDTPDI